MKKPWVIGLLSIIPGLGMVVLGYIPGGLAFFGGTMLLVWLSWLTRRAEDLSAGLFVSAFILWGIQIWFAVLLAKNEGSAKGRSVRRRASAAADPSPSPPQMESVQGAARQALAPLLIPGESLRIALSGDAIGVDARNIAEISLALFEALMGSTPYVSSETRTTYIGITQVGLVYASTRRRPKASDLHRVPVAAVTLAGFEESHNAMLPDKLILQVENGPRLSLSTAATLRPVVQELTLALAK